MVVRGVACLALVAIIGSGCTAGGGCENTVNEIVESAEETRYPDALKNDLRQLRDAALVFAQRGRESECADTANGMDDILDDYTQRIEAKRERARRRAYLLAARPVASLGGIVKTQEVIGKAVYNLKNQELGAIENVALDPDNGQIAYVALASGGFFGLGEKLVAVPWKQLSLTQDGKVYVLALDQAGLEKRKGFDADQWPGQIADKLKASGQRARDTARTTPGETRRGDDKGHAPR